MAGVRSQLLRLLVARDDNVEDAHRMWRKWVAWRKKFAVDDLTPEKVINEIRSGKALWSGKDKYNHPCCLIRPRLHDPKARDLSGVRCGRPNGCDRHSIPIYA